MSDHGGWYDATGESWRMETDESLWAWIEGHHGNGAGAALDEARARYERSTAELVAAQERIRRALDIVGSMMDDTGESYGLRDIEDVLHGASEAEPATPSA